jgi:hypothetical protein
MLKNKKILLIGHARHAKDTVAELIHKHHGLTFKSSSQAAAEIFIYDALRDKYGYQTPEQCFVDRMNRREEWFNLIADYNREDPTRLCREILATNDMYVGMRSKREIDACRPLFDLIIGVYCPFRPLEPFTSFKIDVFEMSDIIIPNAGSLEDLEEKVKRL